MYLILIGGGNVGIQLAKRLLARDQEILLLEKDSNHARRLQDLLGRSNVMHGDGCDLAVQKSAGFARADVVVAVTGEDEDNLIVCQLAKEVWQVKRVLARVNDPSHEEIFRELGIDDTVSATGIIYSLLEQQIGGNDLVPVGALHQGHVEVVESFVKARSGLVGKQVKDLALPPGAYMVYLWRDGAGFPVTPDTHLEANDMIVSLVPIEKAEELRTVLCSAKA